MIAGATLEQGAPASLNVRLANYGYEADAEAIVALLDGYARDPMGGGEGLAAQVKQRLARALDAFPGAFSLLAFEGAEPVGLANCFTAFSTFAARPLVNIHDLVVRSGYRGKGIGAAIMAGVETEAGARGACKITLEVLSGNAPAKALYTAQGFRAYALAPDAGSAQFWEKKL